MAVIETWLRQDLNRLVSVQSLQGQVFSLDNSGNLIGVRVTKNGEPVALAGTVTGYCILSDGQTVNVTGSGNAGIQNGNEAYIVLPQLVYSVPGQISIVIKLTSGSAITTLAACTGYVYRSRTSNEVVPSGTPIPDLATLEEAIRNANTAASSANSAASSANTAATDAENVNVAMSKSGKVITITATNRSGASTSHTVTEPTLTVARDNNVVTVTATDADGQTSIEFDAVDADEVAELKEAVSTKAEEDGYYEELAAGTADQLVSTEAVTDATPYLYRKSGGSVDIGNRETLEKIVGGTVAWNQQIKMDADTWPNSDGGLGAKTADGIKVYPNRYTGTYAAASPTIGTTQIVDHVYYIFYSLKSLNGNAVGGGIYPNGQGTTYRLNASGTKAYLYKKSIVWQLQAGFTCGSNNVTENDYVILDKGVCVDITQMFGSTIADAIYAMEQANAGSGVAWFRKLFPKDYYPYNPGELISVKPASHDMVGFNLWDEEWELGVYDINNGSKVANSANIRNKNLIPVLPNTQYCWNNSVSNIIRWVFFDSDKNYLSYVSNEYTSPRVFTTPENAHYMAFYYGATSYSGTLCINLSHSGTRDGEYEPYEKHSYPFDPNVELRGIVGIDENGKLVYSGDEYTPDGKVNRRFNVVDLGTLNWGVLGDSYPNQFIINTPFYSVKTGTTNILTVRYHGVEIMPYVNQPDKTIMVTSNKYIVIKDTSYTDAAAFKASMSGVMLVYELATPTTETAATYTPVQVVDDWGTEEFVDTREVAIPVGHSTSYMANLRDKLQHLPSLAEEDGEYIVKQTGSQMSLAPFKAGTYPDMHVGVADQLLSKQSIEDQVPYGFRQSGGGLAIGDREEDMIVGGTVGWNQLVPDSISHITRETAVAWNTFVASSFNMPLILNRKYIIALNGKTVARGSIGIRDTVNSIVYRPATPSYAFVYSAPLTTDGTTFIQGNWAEGTTDAYLVAYDLTAMFGSTIADYVYNLEQTTAGAGVAWFRKLFPKDFYQYNPGELKSVEAVNAHETVGFNQLDEEWELGGINSSTGENTTSTNSIRSKNYIKVLQDTYYLRVPDTVFRESQIYIAFYNSEKNFIVATLFNSGNSWSSRLLDFVNGPFFKNKENVGYLRFWLTPGYGTTYNHDICFNISSSRNGEYEPYHKSSYPLDSSLTLRGIPKLDANNKLYYDGDTYSVDGTVTRRYGVVDLGTLAWTKNGSSYTDRGSRFDAILDGMKSPADGSVISNIICSTYTTATFNILYNAYTNDRDKLIAIHSNGVGLCVYDKDMLASATAEQFKAAMSGVMLVYELAEPTTEQAEPYQSVQQVDPYGTEEYTYSGDADVYIPVGHVTKYPSDLRSKIENAPDAPSGNGDYIVRKTAEGVSYVPLTQAKEIPAPPSANGTYRLTVTVANGTPTYSWVSA